MSFSREFLDESIRILQKIDSDAIDRMATELASIRDAGGGFSSSASEARLDMPATP